MSPSRKLLVLQQQLCLHVCSRLVIQWLDFNLTTSRSALWMDRHHLLLIPLDCHLVLWKETKKAVIKRDLDAAKAAWLEYAVDRTRRSDRLRAKIVHQVWEWAVSKSPKFAKVDPEVLFEPSMPGYSYEYLTWIPKTMNWVDEIADLNEAEPWRIGWIDVPEQHPYNTTFAPCNLDAPLFVPADKTREAVGRPITVSPSLMVGEIAWGWDADFRGQNADSEAPESSAVVSNSSSRQASLNSASAGNLSSLQALAQAASAALSEAEDADEAEEED
ncbi:hypothetical protein PR003_g30238 [Phytophthora rubi]|uniref:Uncharacterized protein n=1 Tax=Phytophthora rubi TaxID=129364 RepID=A0A6A4BFF8_9STRA|nr:hypothetical protein PR003_g30238 [Phytophthora rubi]